MKQFIKVFLFAIIILAGFSALKAQTRSRVMPSVTAGYSTVFGTTGYTVSGSGTADTLAVSDSIGYIYPVSATNRWLPFLSFAWTKIGAGTATLAAKFYQGNTSTNCVSPIYAGSANTAYAKSYTLSASTTTPQFVDFYADSAKITGKYIKVLFYTSNTASVQGSIAGTINTVVQ